MYEEKRHARHHLQAQNGTTISIDPASVYNTLDLWTRLPRMNIMRRCLGLTANRNRCLRQIDQGFFCLEHRRQPINWIVFLVFTVAAGTASMQSAWFPEFFKATDTAAAPSSGPAHLVLSPGPSTRDFLSLMVRNDSAAPASLGRVALRYEFRAPGQRPLRSNAQTLRIEQFEKGVALLQPRETKQVFLAYASEVRRNVARNYMSEYSSGELTCHFEIEVVSLNGSREVQRLSNDCRTCCSEYFRLNNSTSVTIPTPR